MEEASLYHRLGDDVLRQLVAGFYQKVLADDRLAHLFTTDIEVIKSKQFKFLLQFFGGPPRYTEEYGHPRMRMRHMPHQITPSAAVAWLECMASAVQSLEISSDLQRELMQRFTVVAARMVNTPD